MCQPHKSFLTLIFSISIPFISSCKKDKHTQITIDSPRDLTIEETFQNIQENRKEIFPHNNTSTPYIFTQPELWKTQAPTDFRILNFTFGDKGEVYLSESRGDILANVNRWLGQFKQPALGDISTLETINLFGKTAYIVETSGSFQGMRMTKPIDNFSLLGIIVKVEGVLITIKMTGNHSEVTSQKSNLFSFCDSLQKK